MRFICLSRLASHKDNQDDKIDPINYRCLFLVFGHADLLPGIDTKNKSGVEE